jgi:hypothetical protein
VLNWKSELEVAVEYSLKVGERDISKYIFMSLQNITFVA